MPIPPVLPATGPFADVARRLSSIKERNQPLERIPQPILLRVIKTFDVALSGVVSIAFGCVRRSSSLTRSLFLGGRFVFR